MHSVLLAVLLSTATVEDVTVLPLPANRSIETEVSAGVGILGSGYSVVAERWGDAALTPSVSAQIQKWGLVGELGAMFLAPVTAQGAGNTVVGQFRVGYAGYRWSVLAGLTAQWANLGRPQWQLLPSLQGHFDFTDSVGATLGVLEQFALVPAHLSVTLFKRYSLGWAFPLGAIGEARFPMNKNFGLKLNAFFFRLAGAEVGMVTLSGTFGGSL
jgi:hypothetical protein